jgi:hypothetical protein
MEETTTSFCFETALRAFAEHFPITIKLTDGKAIGPGYIVMMYGDIAFRMQEENDSSHFVRVSEVNELVKAQQ